VELLLRHAPASIAILALTSIVSLIAFQNPQLLARAVLHPWGLSRTRRYDTLISHGFVHGSGGHLLFNMLTLYSFGPPLEATIGTTGFVALYFLGMLASALGVCVTHHKNREYTALGASGAILAVLFAFIVYYPMTVLRLFFIIPMPATLFAVGFLAYTIWAAKHWRGSTAHEGHFGGALLGMLFVALTDPGAWVDAAGKVARMLQNQE
jgi:membrane associated rhomboid family serine protease